MTTGDGIQTALRFGDGHVTAPDGRNPQEEIPAGFLID